MKQSFPIFKSHYSIGKSILTLEDPEDSPSDGPDSIIEICKSNKLKTLFLVDDSISGFLQAHTNAKKSNIKLAYGLRITSCSDITQKNDASLETNNKIVIFCKNEAGYKKLMKIASKAATDGFYYEPRIDCSFLKEIWSNEDLMLCIPFYDSYIFNNVLFSSKCFVDFSFASPTFFLEDNGLPFDNLIKKKIKKVTEKTQEVQSVFYKERKDFINYLTFRCISNRTSLDKPNLNHMGSDSFCFESWKERQ